MGLWEYINLKKLIHNHKGITIIEILICFTITAVIVVSLFKMINHYKDRQDLASYKSEITAYKDTVTKTIQGNIIKHDGVLDVCDGTQFCSNDLRCNLNGSDYKISYHCDNGVITDQYNDSYVGTISTYLKMTDGTVSYLEIKKQGDPDAHWENNRTDDIKYSITYQENILDDQTKEVFSFPDIQHLEFNEPSIRRDDQSGFLKIYVGSSHPDFNDQFSVLDIRVPLQSFYPNSYIGL